MIIIQAEITQHYIEEHRAEQAAIQKQKKEQFYEMIKYYRDASKELKAKKAEEAAKAAQNPPDPAPVVRTEEFSYIKWDRASKSYILLSESGKILQLSPRDKRLPEQIVPEHTYLIKYAADPDIFHVFSITVK